jgi:type IV pilus assembly protein PilC
MPVHSYVVLDEKGQEKRGKLDALSRADAVRQLRNKTWFVVEVNEGELDAQTAVTKTKLVLIHLDPRRYLPVRQVDRVNLFRQLSLMLRSGHTILQSLESLAGLVERYRLQSGVQKMAQDIREGKSFSRALKDSGLFSGFVSKVMATGEASGDLDSIAEQVADDLERKMELRRQLITSLTYPAITLLVSIAVVLFLVMGVIPKFATFLEGKGTELPPATQGMMDLANFMEIWGMGVGVGVAVFIFLVLASYTTHNGKLVIDRIILKLPLVGSTITSASMAQFGWTLAMLLRSGMTALESLRLSSTILNNARFSSALAYSADEVLRGKSISAAISQPVFPKMVRHLTAVGEQSGEMDSVMEEIGKYYKKDLEARIKRMTAMIEPALILFVGGVVGFVYFAFFQAVMAVSTGGR